MIKDSGTPKRWNGKTNCSGDTRGCQITHGLSKTRIYNIWCDMKRRCNNPKNKRFYRYGGRGIKVCDEWQEDFIAFYKWSMDNGYSEKLTIDRIDVNDDYTPRNCRWVTTEQQQNNTSRNHFLVVDGEKKTIAEWSKITGISPSVIKDRINKLHWTGKEAVTVPILKKGGKYKNANKR